MCLIIIKPKGKKLPRESVLRTAWQNNSDGFGLAYNTNEGQVKIVKGAMKLKQSLQLLKSVPDITNKSVILHFRFATEGRIEPGNCHPFPISKFVNDLKATSLVCGAALAHNGIIPNGEPHKWVINVGGNYTQLPRDSRQEKLSDTQKFIIERLSKMGDNLFNEGVLELIGDYTSSKFAILDGKSVHLIGDFVDDNGCFYSNTSYKQAEYHYSSFDYEHTNFGCSTKAPSKEDGGCDLCQRIDGDFYELEDGSVVCKSCLAYFAKDSEGIEHSKVVKKGGNNDKPRAWEGP